jgi:hypothetical protein
MYLDNVYGSVNMNLVSINKHTGMYNDFIITDL